MRLVIGSLLVALFAAAPTASATSFTLDFDGYADFVSLDGLSPISTPVGTVSFTNGLVLQSGALGGTLNEIDFPPSSGDNVVGNADAGGATGDMTITFGAPLFSLSGYFTYAAPLTLTFTLSNATTSTATSNPAFTENIGTGANPPNEQIQFSSLVGITSVLISAGSSSFALDDLTLNDTFPRVDTAVPEPGTLLLMGTGAAALIRRRRAQKQLKS